MIEGAERDEVLEGIFKFYARMYDAAYELIEEFVIENLESGVFDPDAPGWQEYVGELAVLTIHSSASSFYCAELEAAGLKYLYETERRIITHLDDEVDPIFAWVGVVEVDEPVIGPYVNHPLPKNGFRF